MPTKAYAYSKLIIHLPLGRALGLSLFNQQVMKTLLLKIFFTVHLVVILVGSNLVQYQSKAIDSIVLPYSSWTGGGFGYSFFSPNVGNQTVVKVYTLNSRKELQQDAFGTGAHIFDSRFSSAIHTFRNKKAYELLSRVIASYVFVKYPGSSITHVSVGEYLSPSMSDYRLHKQGIRYAEVYNGTYTN
jgi:hypothetical protein